MVCSPSSASSDRVRRKPVPITVEDRGYLSACWIWQLAKDQKGYAVARREGRIVRAHRWMWMQEHGPVPAGLQLDHLCCVKDCVNPGHLEAVTPGENTRRANKLTFGDVKEIRALVRNGVKQQTVARMFDITQPAVSRIASGKRQREVV